MAAKCPSLHLQTSCCLVSSNYDTAFVCMLHVSRQLTSVGVPLRRLTEHSRGPTTTTSCSSGETHRLAVKVAELVAEYLLGRVLYNRKVCRCACFVVSNTMIQLSPAVQARCGAHAGLPAHAAEQAAISEANGGGEGSGGQGCGG